MLFKLKENVYGKKVSFKENVYEKEQVLKNVSVFLCVEKPPLSRRGKPYSRR